MYSKAVYTALIIVGIIFYILAALHVYQLASSIQNNVVPMFEALSSARVGFRVESVNITQIDEKTIKVLVRAVINITWDKKVPINGPVLEILWMNKTVEKIEIKSLNELIVNKPLTMKLLVEEQNIREQLLVSVIVNTSIGAMKLVQPMANISAILSQTKLVIENIHVEKRQNRDYLIFNITSSQNTLKAPVKIILLDDSKNVLVENYYEDFHVDPSSKYEVFLDITGIDPNSIKYVKITVYGVQIALFELGG